MSKKLFTENEIKQLSKNPSVKTVSTKGITYTDEFKRLFIAEKEKGKLSRQIFEEAGFDPHIIGLTRIKAASRRWSVAYERNGITELIDTRKGHSGRPREREFSLEEKNARLEAQINLLKGENELLKKIRFEERRMKK